MDRMASHTLGKADGSAVGVPVISAVAGVWSRGAKIGHGKSFCLSVLATVASGTPDVDLYLEQTHIEVSGQPYDQLTGSLANGWAQPVGASKIADIIAADTWYHFTVSPVVLPWLRIKAVGQGANPASTVLTILLTELDDLAS